MQDDDTPLCGSCPAFLVYPESVEVGRCFGCRQPPAQFVAEADGTVKPRYRPSEPLNNR